jgi:hypothetical protein
MELTDISHQHLYGCRHHERATCYHWRRIPASTRHETHGLSTSFETSQVFDAQDSLHSRHRCANHQPHLVSAPLWEEISIFESFKSSLADLSPMDKQRLSKLANIVYAHTLSCWSLQCRYMREISGSDSPVRIQAIGRSRCSGRSCFLSRPFLWMKASRFKLWVETAKDVDNGEYYEPICITVRGYL